MSYVSIYNKNGKRTNRISTVEKVHNSGAWHNEIFVWIILDNKILLCKKNINEWTINTGHQYFNELPIEGANRLISTSFENEVKNGRMECLFLYENQEKDENIRNNSLCYVYLFKMNPIYLDDINLNENLLLIDIEELLLELKHSNLRYPVNLLKQYKRVLNFIK